MPLDALQTRQIPRFVFAIRVIPVRVRLMAGAGMLLVRHGFLRSSRGSFRGDFVTRDYSSIFLRRCSKAMGPHRLAA